MELGGEDLVCYSNKIKSVCLTKRLYDRKLIDKAYLGDTIATNIIRVLPTIWRRKPAGIDTERNYVTVALCIGVLVGTAGKCRHILGCKSATF